MKYLLILLFLFSTHSFSGEIDGKKLYCVSKFKDKKKDSLYAILFNDSRVAATYIKKYDEKGGFYELIISPAIPKYKTDENYIKWNNVFMNRKTLEIHENNETIALCELANNMEHLTNILSDRINNLNLKLEKAREGNKI